VQGIALHSRITVGQPFHRDQWIALVDGGIGVNMGGS
jgi:hypothetical protein